jgi:hypothetical protein
MDSDLMPVDHIGLRQESVKHGGHLQLVLHVRRRPAIGGTLSRRIVRKRVASRQTRREFEDWRVSP